MLHWTSTAARPAEGGLVTFEQVRGARDWYWGSIVTGPETPAALCPAPSPPALLHATAVKSTIIKTQSAARRMPFSERILNSLSQFFG
jgi:hypothetical protein